MPDPPRYHSNASRPAPIGIAFGAGLVRDDRGEAIEGRFALRGGAGRGIRRVGGGGVKGRGAMQAVVACIADGCRSVYFLAL